MNRAIRAYIIEDEPKGLANLMNLLSDLCPQVEVIGTNDNIKEGWKELLSATPELVFLDMHLPDGLGYEIVSQPETRNVHFIFTTAFEDFALKAFDLGATDYLLKPIRPKRLREAVQRVITQRRDDTFFSADSTNNRITLPVVDGMEFIDCMDIMYCGASGPYVELFMANGEKKIISKNLGKFEEMLAPRGFIRIHDSFLINPKRITKYIRGRGGQVVMENGRVLGVAQRRKEQFLRQFVSNEL